MIRQRVFSLVWEGDGVESAVRAMEGLFIFFRFMVLREGSKPEKFMLSSFRPKNAICMNHQLSLIPSKAAIPFLTNGSWRICRRINHLWIGLAGATGRDSLRHD